MTLSPDPDEAEFRIKPEKRPAKMNGSVLFA
jgi:hypothetical protein